MVTAQLHADSIGKRYGAARVLTAATLSAYSGRITALVGRNGSGKSTLLKICAGWLPADHGRIAYAGRIRPRPKLHELAREGLCLLPADQPLLSPSFRIVDQLQAIARSNDTSVVDEIVDRLRLGTFLERYTTSLSGGERRRASFAVAELLNPSCLLADEPLRDLAPLDAELVMSSLRGLRNRGCAIVVTGHDTSSLFELADDIVWLTAGTTHHIGTAAAAREHWQFDWEFLGNVGRRATL